MYDDTFDALSNAARNKSRFLKKRPIGYFISSMMAGAFIGFGNILINTIGGLLNGAPATKIVMGAAFGIALSLVVIAGAELFTGNTLVMSAGVMKKKVSIKDMLILFVVCWIGNLAGSVLLAWLFELSGMNTPATAKFLATGALAKMSAGALQLFVRGILCNILVCLAVWCGFRCKSDSGKLIMVFWCLFAFIICGFEHSIANMTQLSVALLNPAGLPITLSGYFYNLIIVTLGNIVGGIVFVALPYFLATNKD
ncbi:formate/nitrite transporter family protein [Sharpea azabuensis]|uniref:formate/nitrite transporter family protein n=1 Tax=Sharpea azabuensis TaxID=322505 RepID=UPI0024090210|nr:formate/nitrite transporter family protein [Sharpea azabuensis]MDD6511707.1 formate/nitrite transporter family protein [Sharpea azabuensis]